MRHVLGRKMLLIALAPSMIVQPVAMAAGNNERDGNGLGRRPAWIAIFCTRAASTMRRSVLCPDLAPTNLLPTINTSNFVPTRTGYILDAGGKPLTPGGLPTSHWVFIATTGPHIDNGPSVALRSLRIRSRNAVLDYFAGSGNYVNGLVSFHVGVTWAENGVKYLASVHDAMPGPLSPNRWTSADRAYVLHYAAPTITQLEQVVAGMKMTQPHKR